MKRPLPASNLTVSPLPYGRNLSERLQVLSWSGTNHEACYRWTPPEKKGGTREWRMLGLGHLKSLEENRSGTIKISKIKISSYSWSFQ
jgi:hypothetical protein